MAGELGFGGARDGGLFVDDIQGEVSFGLEEVNEGVAGMVGVFGERRKRDAEILGYRLGIGGEGPETLARIGARFDLARDRVRQLHTRAVGQMLREAALSRGQAEVFEQRYPVDGRDSALTRALLVETYATDTDLAANELSYLKLRLAGHAPEDAKRIAGYVMQRIMAWQKKTNRQLAKLRDAEPAAATEVGEWSARIEWTSGAPAALPTSSARTVDGDDDGRGRFYLDKVGRDVGFDSALQARLLRTLNAADLVETFQEHPVAVPYDIDGSERVHYPTVGARLTDGRVVLIDVQPLGHVAFHVNRVRSAAARARAHAEGWGWLVWTGSRLGLPELARREVDARHEAELAELIERGSVPWHEVRRLHKDSGLELLDFTTLVLRNEWRWDRGPFRLTRP
ncbi:sigma factor-like helix-turn-helix DNA-binding protein [Nocardia bhagyanarayanae]|uniref:Sigma-70-like protein n=1 Tax=Nocardia bhagyanarayanae TaxID=1215925 RepID=A0A543FD35_9NOCA|nr:sigma factor-like helix-turn-helix DNA-binding protein [Nocardia bhagyanarayanae]TQM31737.1 sigma-70-like protein [Nocardia bhagyanarayanae]